MTQYELNWRDYYRVIRKRKWFILAVFLSITLSGYLYSRQQVPVYEAVTTVRIYARQPIASLSEGGITFWGARSTLESEIELIKSDRVLEKVVRESGYVNENADELQLRKVIASLRNKIIAERLGLTDLVQIKARDTEPGQAVKMSTEVAYSYIEDNWQRKVNETKTARKFIERQLKLTGEKLKKTEDALTQLKEKGEAISSVMPLQEKLSDLELRLSELTQKYTDNHPEVLKVKEQMKTIKEQLKNLPEKELLFARLSRQLKTSERLYTMLKERYEGARIAEASKTKDVQIVNPAVEPTTPVGPRKGGNLFVSGLIGIILGLVVAMVAESMDTSIGTIEDVEQYLKLPVLGVIPHIKFKDEALNLWKKSSSVDNKQDYGFIQRLIMQHQSSSLIAEAYKTLQASIKFNGLDKVGNSFMFTSVGSQEGKTITVTNCALSFAQMGKRVLVVDADLRRPSIHKIFGIERDNGLTDLILGTLKLDEVIKTVLDILLGQVKAKEILRAKGMENLSIITSGHLPSNPPGLLNSPEMSSLIKEFKDKFDIVLFDCPPVLPVVDAVILASKVEGAVLVYQVGKVARGVLKRTKVQLENAKAKPIGVVLNNIKASEMELVSPYYYQYQQYYGKEEE